MIQRCLIWGTGICFKNNIRLIQYYEQCGQIKIIGITSDESFYTSIFGYSFMNKCEIDPNEFDVLIVASGRKNFGNIKNEAMLKGISEEKIVPVHVMALPGFDFNKYSCIKKNPPTIFAPNCWGGLTYHSLGLEFKSPFVNMYMMHTDYMKFLKNPRYYLACPLTFEGMGYEQYLKTNFPIARCGDVLLYFNHYSSFEEAELCWNRRKERIDWNNMFVMFYDRGENLLNEFLKLPYEKKVCFVPYTTDEKNQIGLDYQRIGGDKPFGQFVNTTANGETFFYDVFDLLLYGKITLLVETKQECSERNRV